MTAETSNARGETYTFDMIEDAWGDVVPLTKPYFNRFRARLETLRQSAAPQPAAAQQQGLTESWQDEWRSAVAAKLSSYGLSEEAAAVFAESELGEYRAGLCDCAENDPADMVDLMMGVALDAIEKWKAESAGRPFGYKRTAPPSAPVGVDAPGSRAWMAEVCRAAALSLAAHGVRNDQLSKVADWITQQPAAAEPKTLPVPTRVYLIGETAVIVGAPERGWDEDAKDAHNCDAMGCETIGPHVLARVPFTDERAMSQPAEARGVVDGAVGTVTRVGTFEVQEHRIELDPEFDERLNNMPEGTVVRLYAAPVRDLTQKQLADAAAALATQHQEPTT